MPAKYKRGDIVSVRFEGTGEIVEAVYSPTRRKRGYEIEIFEPQVVSADEEDLTLIRKKND